MPTPNGLRLVDAHETHLEAIRAIYAPYVLHDLCTFEETVPSEDEMHSRWQSVTALGLPYVVALQGGRVAGFGYAGAWRTRAAYRFTIEHSVYVERTHHGHGMGGAILDALIARCEDKGAAQMIAVIGNRHNRGSIGLHESRGFRHVGVLEKVGYKFDQWVDTVLMQRSLGKASNASNEGSGGAA